MAAVRLGSKQSMKQSMVFGAPTLQMVPRTVRVRFTGIVAGFSTSESGVKPVVTAALNGAAVGSPTQTSEGAGLVTLLGLVRSVVVRRLKVVMRPRPWSLIVQSLVEKVIMDTRFFTILGVAGTLLGSVLCFLEGVFLVVESYIQYFHAMYHHSDPGHIMYLLIEALDMFLVGTAMLMFGMGLHVMFVRSRSATQANCLPIPPSNFFGLFHLKEIPSWAGMKSISEAKSKIGHALMLLLQVGVLEKFKSIPLVSGLDLACFAAAIFVTSACLFILSRLPVCNTPTQIRADVSQKQGKSKHIKA